MLTNQREYWNNEFSKSNSTKPRYDLWLDKYADILEQSKETPVIDLGCGLGGDSLYLAERGYKVISCDLSEAALEKVKANIAVCQTVAINLLQGLPFEESSAKIIIADLCLHYFYWKDTVKIVNDIKRALIPGGYLLCRVNSTKDTNYGAGQGDRIEENYFDSGKIRKRFFSREQIEELFTGWNFKYLSEYQMDRYQYPKILWEIAVQR